MATYEYECPGDGEIIIITRPIDEEEGVYVCTVCTSTLRRVYTTPAVKFNAPGFYSTGG
jgi:predicted nucleic acid-binding Zn ribbon protein